MPPTVTSFPARRARTGASWRSRPYISGGHVEGPRAKGLVDRGGVERIGVDVLDDRGDLVALVPAGVQHRDGEAPVEEPTDDVRPGRPGAADDECRGCHRTDRNGRPLAGLASTATVRSPDGPVQHRRRAVRRGDRGPGIRRRAGRPPAPAGPRRRPDRGRRAAAGAGADGRHRARTHHRARCPADPRGRGVDHAAPRSLRRLDRAAPGPQRRHPLDRGLHPRHPDPVRRPAGDAARPSSRHAPRWPPSTAPTRTWQRSRSTVSGCGPSRATCPSSSARTSAGTSRWSMRPTTNC